VYRDLARFLASRVLGTLGMQIQSVAIGWQIYERTGRPLDLAWVGLAQFLPMALLSLWAGSLADRFDRKRILIASRVVFGLGAGALALLSLFPEWGEWPIYGVLVVLGGARAFAAPATLALLPALVPIEKLQRAIGLSSSTSQASTVAGPAVGGLVYGLGGPALAYGAAAALEILSAIAILFIRRELPKREAPAETGIELLLSGVRYTWQHKILFGAISLDLFAVLLGGAVALMPIFAGDVLHVGEVGLGLLRSAPAAGAAVIALAIAYRPIEKRAGVWMLASVVIFGLATIVFGLSESFALSLGALAVLGASDMVSVQIRHTLVQLQTPDEMRGRVSSVSMVFIGASNELGEFESGLTAEWLGAKWATIVGGLGTLAVTGVWAILFPDLRRADSLESREKS
jgi:MFS family permease